jgi:predicted TPR repeat methyltransferase
VTVVAEDHARAAYEVFAASYDRWTAGHDQEHWTGVVLRLAEAAGFEGTRLLDVGCGTGSAIPPMIERGFSVAGTDISPAMIALARAKLGDSARLSVADMRSLPALGESDLVWSLCDVVNYLLDEQELFDAFCGYRRNLAPGGIVAFDVDSLATLRKLYSSLLVVQDDSGLIVFDGRSPEDLPSGGVA